MGNRSVCFKRIILYKNQRASTKYTYSRGKSVSLRLAICVKNDDDIKNVIDFRESD